MNAKNTHKKIVVTFILLQVLLTYSFIVSSDDPPTLPHRFYGTAKNLDAHNVADGLVVRAQIIDLDNHTTQNFTTTVSSGAYDFDTQIKSEGGDTGDIIYFYINNVNTTQSATFMPGGNTELNLIYPLHDQTGGGSEEGGIGPAPGGTNNTPPTANAGGPYIGYVNASITFNGSKSKDSDGNITGYRWDFTNDGTYDTDWLLIPTTPSTYKRVGHYTVKLQVKDNNNATGNATANVTIKPLPIINASSEAMNMIQITFGLKFTQPFYATDTNGDGVVDTFTDPNHLLTLVRFINISGNASYLLSTGNDMIPEFFWDTKANKTVLLTFISVQLTETWIDPDAQEILIVADVEKSGWVYIKIIDPYPPEKYPNFTLTVKTTDDRIISSEMVWREKGNIYILDDPSVQYILIYGYTILPPVFNPPDGTILNIARPTITITFFEETILTITTFENNNILDKLTTIDHKTYIFTPASDLVDGTYTLSLTVQDNEGNTLTSTSTYTIDVEQIPTTEIPWLIFMFFSIVLSIIVILVILRRRLII
jgi:hypothetical protein